MRMGQEDGCTVALLKDYFIASFFATERVAVSLNKIHKVGKQEEKWKRGNRQTLPGGLLKMDKA